MAEEATLITEIRKIVHEALDASEYKISKDEITEIIQDLLPDLNELISKNVKKHFIELANHILETFDKQKE